MNELICTVCKQKFYHRNGRTKCCSDSCRNLLKKDAQLTLHVQERKTRQDSVQQPRYYRLLAVGHGISTKVDIVDFAWASEYPWHVDHRGYVVSKRHGSRIALHRAVFERTHGFTPPANMHLDHQHGNKLDNRRKKIRLATPQENQFNSASHIGTSRYKGVSRHTTNPSWVASIHINRRKIHLGSFKTEIDAALAYDVAAIQLFGGYAWLNIIGRRGS